MFQQVSVVGDPCKSTLVLKKKRIFWPQVMTFQLIS